MGNDKIKQHWDGMYDLPSQNIPWEIEEPPRELVKFLDDKYLETRTVLDVGCGTGNYSVYLAKKGFKVTGVDISKRAIQLAKDKNSGLNLDIEFLESDLIGLYERLQKQFDFIFEYSILHHIPDIFPFSHGREKMEITLRNYADEILNLLKPGGYYLLVCYSEKDSQDGNRIKLGEYGNNMYYRTKTEIQELYKSLKVVEYYESALGKRAQHPAHCFIFQKE